MSDEYANKRGREMSGDVPFICVMAKSSTIIEASKMPAIDRSLVIGVPIFAECSSEMIDDILRDARSTHIAKNSNVFEQGENADFFFLLLHGRVKAYRLTPAGEQVVIRFIAPGEMFGVAMAIGRDAYPATAVAVVDCVVIAWPTAAWPGLLARHPALAVNAMQTLGARLQESQLRVMEMSTEEVERRVAHALLRLANQGGRKTDEGILIDFPISRQDIAQMTGTTLHTVSRIMSAWETAGLVSSGRQKVVIRDPHKLYLLAESSET
jgi:CRP/FNR family transcriptional regulator, nitrogen oxide reductase regulator